MKKPWTNWEKVEDRELQRLIQRWVSRVSDPAGVEFDLAEIFPPVHIDPAGKLAKKKKKRNDRPFLPNFGRPAACHKPGSLETKLMICQLCTWYGSRLRSGASAMPWRGASCTQKKIFFKNLSNFYQMVHDAFNDYMPCLFGRVKID